MGTVAVTPLPQVEPTLVPGQPPTRTSINLVGADGSSPQRWLEDEQEKLGLAWGASASGPVITYSRFQPARSRASTSRTAYLYALNPLTGQVRQVYPYLDIVALECPRHIPAGKAGTVRFGILNHSPLTAQAPILMRAGPQRFAA